MAQHLEGQELSPLCIAAKNGNIPVMHELLAQHAEDVDIERMFCIAAVFDHPEVIQLLIEQGLIHVNYVGKSDNITLLHVAAAYGLTKFVTMLLNMGADTNILATHFSIPYGIDCMRASALHLAAAEGHLDIVQALIDKGAGKDIQDFGGMTPLHLAIVYKQNEAAKLLIKNRAKVNVRDNFNRTPLHFAAFEGIADVVYALLEADADQEAECDDDDDDEYISISFNGRRKPVDIAGLGRHHEVVRILTTAKYHKTALHLAAEKGELEKVRTLIAAGEDPNILDLSLATPLHYATITEHYAVVKELIAAGANVNAQDGMSFIPLLYILIKQEWVPVNQEQDEKTEYYLKIIKALITAGSDRALFESGIMDQFVPVRTVKIIAYLESISRLESELRVAVSNGDYEQAHSLLGEGAPGTITDEEGNSLLHIAMRQSAQGNQGPIRFDFIARDIIRTVGLRAVKVYDSNGQTPLHIAVQRGNLLMAEYLLRHRADVNALDAEKNTPLHYATSLQMRNKLLRHGADFSLCNGEGKNPISRNIKIWIQDFRNPNI
jgi:cytohesin